MAPLRPAADALVVDTAGVSLEAVVDRLVRDVQARRRRAEGLALDGRTYGPRECGSCRLWRPILEDERGPIGPCRLGVRTGDFPGTAPACERYLSREAAVPSAPPPDPVRRRAPRAVAPAVHRTPYGAEHPERSGARRREVDAGRCPRR